MHLPTVHYSTKQKLLLHVLNVSISFQGLFSLSFSEEIFKWIVNVHLLVFLIMVIFLLLLCWSEMVKSCPQHMKMSEQDRSEDYFY